VSGSYYHIYNRGNNRQTVFFETDNYPYFLRGVKKYLLPVVDMIVYCLMPTHYHLLARVKGAENQTSEVSKTSEVSFAMQKLLISYTKAINKRFDRVGSLFQGAFQAKPITNSKHLLHLCRYIHANPVKDGLVADPADWPYSNYLEWIGERDGKLVDHEFVKSQFTSPIEYRDFVLDYLRSRVLPEDIQLFLNSLEG
jgi:REP element-mobilizing transposase RayT